MKKLLITVAFVGLALAALYPFRGVFPPIYYAQFNDVRDCLHEIEGLKIKDYWQHNDMRLEDCGFDVEIGSKQVSLTFSDHQDWVALFDKMDGIRLPRAGHQRLVTCEQMNSAGIKIDGLSDILENLGSVIEFCSDQANLNLVSDEQYDYQDHLNYAVIEFL